MKKIITIVGARPQFIKASVVSHAIAQIPTLNEVVVHTGQHFDSNMSDIFFSELGISKPDFFLDIHGGSHGEMTGRMLSEIERILLSEKPDVVLVYGDTNSTLAGALAAAKLHIPVAHVEAGLRSFNMKMPEEINRILTDRISSWLFSPTAVASEQLLREGFDLSNIYCVGDVMYDAALFFGDKVGPNTAYINSFGLTQKEYVLATIHRAENTNNLQRLTTITNSLISIADEIPVVWPLHPRTRGVLRREGMYDALAEKVLLIDPVGYLDMVQFEKFSAAVATDSGGVQKEAFFYRVPCVTIRDQTEWTELVDAGWNRLAPPVSVESVKTSIMNALGSKGKPIQPYGDGKSAAHIARILADSLGE